MRDGENALEQQNIFYETIRAALEANSFGKWAVVSREELIGVYDTNGEASEVVLKLSPGQTCLVKRIGYILVASHPFVRVSSAPFRDL